MGAAVLAEEGATMAQSTKQKRNRTLQGVAALGLLALGAGVAPGAHAQNRAVPGSRVAPGGGVTQRSGAPAQGGTATLADPQTELRPFLSGAQGKAQWFASTDPKHGNDDYLLLKPGETRTVPLPVGRLLRLWSTALRPDKLRLVLTTESPAPGEAASASRAPAALLDNNRAQYGTLSEKAYTLYPTLHQSERVSTLGKGATLTLTNLDTQENKVFYQVAVGPLKSAPEAKNPSTGLSTLQQAALNIAPGETKQVGQLSGTGYIWRIVVTLGKGGAQSLLTTRLQAHWDAKAADGADPAPAPFDVDVPLAAFVADFREAQPTKNALAQLTDKQLVIDWPMPFASGATLSLQNAGEQPFEGSIKIQTANTARPTSLYRFHAALGSGRSQKGKPFAVLQVKGAGVFCGLALDMRPATDSPARSFAYLEGNETIEADGKKYEGTGTEDFFNSAWYFPAQPFAQSYAGMTAKSVDPPQVTAYRWMIPDAVPFKQSLNFNFEQGNGNNRDDLEYRWAAFWYQGGGGTATVPNTLGDAPAGSTGASDDEAPASGTAQTDWRFLLVLFGGLMSAVAFFLVRRNVRRGPR